MSDRDRMFNLDVLVAVLEEGVGLADLDDDDNDDDGVNDDNAVVLDVIVCNME